MQCVRAIWAKAKERIHSRRGFSLLDVIVATAIIAMITGISITYNHSSEDQLRIFKAQALIVGAVNRAKSYAAERFIGKNVPSGSFACAFGVHFDAAARKAVIFEDIKATTTIYTCLNADGTYSPSLSAAGEYYNGPNEMIDEVSIDDQLAMSIKSGGADILFVPPDLSAISNGAFPLVVRLAGLSGGYSDTSITAGGQVSTR